MTNFLQPDPQISQISPNLVIFQLDELSGKSKFSQGPNVPIIKKKLILIHNASTPIAND